MSCPQLAVELCAVTLSGTHSSMETCTCKALQYINGVVKKEQMVVAMKDNNGGGASSSSSSPATEEYKRSFIQNPMDLLHLKIVSERIAAKIGWP